MTPNLCGINVMLVTPSLRTGIGDDSATKLPVMLGVEARDGILIVAMPGPKLSAVPIPANRLNTGDGCRFDNHDPKPCIARSPAQAGTLVSAPRTAARATHAVFSWSA